MTEEGLKWYKNHLYGFDCFAIRECLECVYFRYRNALQPICCHNSKRGFDIRTKNPSTELGRPKKCPIIDKKEVDEVTLEGLYNRLALHIENRKKESEMIEKLWERIKVMEAQNDADSN